MMKVHKSSEENKMMLNKRNWWIELVLFYQDINILYSAILFLLNEVNLREMNDYYFVFIEVIKIEFELKLYWKNN
jgi:hypothetical protein